MRPVCLRVRVARRLAPPNGQARAWYVECSQRGSMAPNRVVRIRSCCPERARSRNFRLGEDASTTTTTKGNVRDEQTGRGTWNVGRKGNCARQGRLPIAGPPVCYALCTKTEASRQFTRRTITTVASLFPMILKTRPGALVPLYESELESARVVVSWFVVAMGFGWGACQNG
ncbi:uncharacterized protein LOC143215637 [Lasioglossum baleicum]|uniref:uncharacterized protein LOC143215637 n=1 Tax=Lasioglossum baleicum TaxID=434251 RepID=UPI003FCE3F4A